MPRYIWGTVTVFTESPASNFRIVTDLLTELGSESSITIPALRVSVPGPLITAMQVPHA